MAAVAAENTCSGAALALPRGGWVVTTRIGPIQFGMPPETIKDAMSLGLPIPRHFVVPSERFNRNIGPNCGINVAEFVSDCHFFFNFNFLA